MRNIIFTKYSNERSDEFKIATSIIEGSDGAKLVEKRPLTEQAKKHIENIYDIYLRLSDYYKGTKLEMNKCSLCDCAVQLEYIEGESLESRLDKLLEEEKLKELFDEIKKYISVIKNVEEIVPFKPCNEFKDIFGDILPMEGIDAFKISNIDMTFSNIIINDRWNVIDYEWTFDFPVPVNYVVYRAVKFYSELFTKRRGLTEKDIYSFLGINKNERKVYEHMEECFQAYTLRGYNPSWRLYDNLRGENINVREIIEREINCRDKIEIQVFFDYGDGFSEENSYKLLKDFNEEVEIKAALHKNVKAVRLDPCGDYCLVNVINAFGRTNGYYNLNLISNAISEKNNTFIFDTNDPQFYVNEIKPNTEFLYFKLKAEKISCETALNLSEMIVNYNEKAEQDTKTIIEHGNVVREQAGIIDMLNQKLAEIQFQINSLNAENEEKGSQISRLNAENEEKSNEISRLNAENEEKSKLNIDLSSDIREKESIIDNKTAEINDLREKLSLSDKLVEEYRQFFNVIKRSKFWWFFEKYLRLRKVYKEIE